MTLRPLNLMSALWSTAVAAPPVAAGAGALYGAMFGTLRHVVIGRRVTVHTAAGPATMTVSAVESGIDLRRHSVGKLDHLRIVATDIRWRNRSFDRLSAELRNVYLRPGTRPEVVAAPVHLTLDVPAGSLGELFASAAPRLSGHVDADGVARVHWARWPRLGSVEVDVAVETDSATVSLQPRAVGFRRRRWLLPSRTPAYRVRLPDLPHGLLMADVRFEPGLLQLSGTVPQWRLDLSRHLEDLLEF
ncbi:MAG: hypothetical protein WBB07_04505 [Mycobacterium sp.]